MVHHIKTGFRLTFQNKKLIAIFYFFNFIVGFILMLPLRQALQTFGGQSLLMRNMAGAFNMDFLIDFITHRSHVLSIMIAIGIFGFLLYQLIQLFLSGGLFSLYLSDGRYESHTFWGNSALYWGKFFRLALWSLLLLAVMVGGVFLFKGIERMIWGKHPYETTLYWNKVFRIVLLQVVFIVYGMILDYSRMVIVQTHERQTRKALLAGVRFVYQNFSITLGIALSIFLMGLVWLLIYNSIANILTAPAAFIIFLLFIWQQTYMVGHLILQLALYGAESSLFKTRTRT